MWQPGDNRLRTGTGVTLRRHAHQHRKNSEGIASWAGTLGRAPSKTRYYHWQALAGFQSWLGNWAEQGLCQQRATWDSLKSAYQGVLSPVWSTAAYC